MENFVFILLIMGMLLSAEQAYLTPELMGVRVAVVPSPSFMAEARAGPIEARAGSGDDPRCPPTRVEPLGPFYKGNAPERSKVGQGYLLRGTVMSSGDCRPIEGARLEFWLAGPNGQYDDDHRATVFSDESGKYSFESNFPPKYSFRPPHVHLRVLAAGFQTLVTQHYPVSEQTQGTFDLVFVPVGEGPQKVVK
jgi:protocatechuate 3,4-dioxygenase beta subunit